MGMLFIYFAHKIYAKSSYKSFTFDRYEEIAYYLIIGEYKLVQYWS